MKIVQQTISIVISVNLLFSQFLYANDLKLEVDKNAALKHQATLDKANNGVQIVNIVDPNAKGMSHNKFKEYNVNSSGLILNNSKGVTNTQLAGYISYNPNLVNNAKVILNEVTGTNKSLLKGYTEVAGVNADVIVANPNGLTINGAGFINTNKVTLTTGTPYLLNSFVDGFNVNSGDILIEGNSFNTSNINRVELLSNALKINTKFYANNLKVITGDNQISLDGAVVSNNIASSGVSIDSYLLGGIYANTIELVSSNHGVGVNLPSEIVAQDSLNINANGDILLADVSSNEEINIKTSQTLENLETMQSSNINLDTNSLNNSGLIQANNIDIKTDTLTNNAAIYSKDNLKVQAADVVNNEMLRGNNNIDLQVANTLTNSASAVIFADSDINIASNQSKDKINTVINKGLIQSNSNINVVAKELKNNALAPIYKTHTTSSANKIGRGHSNNYDIVTTTINTEYIDTPNIPALILSNKDVNIDVTTLNNEYSLISANEDIVLNAATANNIGKLLTKTTTVKTDVYRNDKYFKYKWRERSEYKGTTINSSTKQLPISNYGIQAQGTISGNVVNLNNINANASQDGLYQTNKTKALESVNNSILSNNSLEFDTLLPSGKFGLFVLNENTNHPYLIESNPIYTNYSEFVSSDYLLSKLEHSAENVIKRLGDGIYETTFVRDTIIQLTGDRYLDGFTSDKQQFQALMDNALLLQEDLNLSYGVSLNSEQIQALNKDIVWMEEKIVNNQKVLVPVVYLASINEQDLIGGAKIAAKKDIVIVATNDVVNQGLISSDNNTVIQANNIINQGGDINSKESILLNASNNINGVSVNIEAQKNVYLNANNVNIQTAQINKEYNYSNGYEKVTAKGQTSTLSAGENVVVNSQDSINLIGADVTALEDVSLQAQNKVSINSIQTNNKFDFGGGDNYYRGENIKNSGSNVSGENVVVNSKTLDVTYSNINANSNIVLNAVEDVNILATNDLAYQDIQTTSKGFLSKSSQRDMTYKEDVVSSNLNAKNIVISSGNDITLEASKLKANENILIDAKGDANILSKEYKEGELHQTSKSSWGGLKKSVFVDKLDSLNLKEATLQTQALNIIIKSGKDINIIASDITSAADVQLEAFDKLNILAGQELVQEQKYREKTSFNPLGLLSIVGIDAGPIYSQEIDENKNYNSKVKQSNIVAQNSINAHTGSARIIGSNIVANKDINISSDINKVEILSAQEFENASSLNKKVEVSLNNMVDIVKDVTEMPFTSLGDITSEDPQTKIKINVARAIYDKNEVTTQATNNVSSNIVSNSGSVNITSSDDVSVVGSNLVAKEDITLSAKTGDVIIQEAINTKNVDENSTNASAEVNVTVQNEYVEIGTAIKDAKDSADQLKQIKDDYSNYKKEVKKLENTLEQLKQDYKNKVVGVDKQDIEDLQEIVDSAKDDEKYYLAAVAAATADLASKTVAITKQAATAAASSGTYGFSAGVFLDVQGSKTDAKNQQTTSVASNLNAKNITIKTNKDIDTDVTISGSNLLAQEELNIQTNDLTVKSSIDSSISDSQKESLNGSVSMTMYGASAGPSVSLGVGKEKSSRNSIKNNNSQLHATNIILDVNNDASFKGAKVHANEKLTLNVGYSLNIESQRDTSDINTNGYNLGTGFSTGTNGNLTSANGSVGVNSSTTKVKQTILTSVAGKEVEVNVNNNTNLKGSLLAAGEYRSKEFETNENLKLSTNTLTFSNSSNSSYNTGNNFNVATNIGFEGEKVNNEKDIKEQEENKNSELPTKDPQADNNSKAPSNSSNVAFGNSLGYESSKALATLGKGDIIIKDKENSDDLTILNTNINNIQKDIVSVGYGVDVDANIDHRFFTKEGRESISKDYKELNKNMNIIAKTLPDANSENKVEAIVGEVWNIVASLTGGILPSYSNHGGLLADIPVVFGNEDSNHYIDSEKGADGLYKDKYFYINGILNTSENAKKGALNISGSKQTKVAYNPSYGWLGDILESTVEMVGGETGISKQLKEFQNNVKEGTKIYLHSQGHQVAESGARPGFIKYESFGAPMSEETVSKIYGIDIRKVNQNPGDYVSNPLNIFNPTTWFEKGHSTEDYKKEIER